jgi:GH15 family glucan-1,4-alpha-glucosidase
MPLAIEDYGLIGDGETAALVGRNGSIDWLCWPRFDSGACFAHLLGTPQNGYWQIAPVDETAHSTRAYRGDTLVLDTRFETATGVAIVTDFMTTETLHSHVVRIVTGVSGTVAMRTEFVVRFDYGAIIPWMRRHEDGTLHAVAGPDEVILQSQVLLHPDDHSHKAQFSVTEAQTVAFVLTYTASYGPQPLPIDADAALRRTLRGWRKWAKGFTGAGEWSAEVMRSLLTLRALIYKPSGGIVAAPTTSLPERLGGVRNWDYRFCWLRDATFTLFALMNNGFHKEALDWRNWLLRAVGGTPSQVQILYGLGGERRTPEMEISWLSGYAGSLPVRIGNAAADQLQLDIFGEVLNSLYQGRVRGLVSDDADWPLQCELLGHLAKIWAQPDEGIWETRGGRRQFTYSKVMSWVAFDRAIKTVERFGFSGPVEEWRSLRQQIHDEVCAKAYDPEVGAFTQSYGSKDLDASVLLLPLVGFLPHSDKRVQGTIAAIEKTLMVGGLIARYQTDDMKDGLPPGEGVFLACSFWFVDNIVLLGRQDEARAMFKRLLGLCNDIGLLAEEYDTVHQRLVGNFPQAFSHIALINTASNLAHYAAHPDHRGGEAGTLPSAPNQKA